MEYYEDSHILNDYLHYWRDSYDIYWEDLANNISCC
jgi:hypothetical protein